MSPHTQSIAHADADLPSKAGLSERRAKYDSIKARQQAQLEALEQQAAAGKRPREEDDLYLEARAQADVRTHCRICLRSAWFTSSSSRSLLLCVQRCTVKAVREQICTMHAAPHDQSCSRAL